MKTLVTIIRPVVALAGLAALAGRNGLKPTSICCQRGSIQNALFGGNRRSLGASSMADFEPVTSWIRRPDPSGKVGGGFVAGAEHSIGEALERLVQLYDAWGQPAPAAEWKQKLAAVQQANKAAEKKGAQR